MTHRFQNIHGIIYTVSENSKDMKADIQEIILGVMEDKKLPFKDVYVRLPLFLFSKFMNVAQDSGLAYKEMETRKNFFHVRF